MALFIILLFIVFIGLVAVAYLLATDKESGKNEHKINPHVAPKTTAVISEGIHSEEPWTIPSINKEFTNLKEQIHELKEIQNKPSQGESLKGFFAYAGYSLQLMVKEKEIFTFALLQWTAIAAGYYLWVQMLNWIPPEVWESTRHSRGGSPADYVLLAWSFVCVGIVAFPLSIFSACMGAVHFINRQGGRSTIAGCLGMVLPKLWSLWVFTWVDGWITVTQILKRLPKKRRGSPTARALSEAIYYAWKIGTIGILPGLITGRGLVESCRQSIDVVRHKFKEVVRLRIGYSVLCWIVGISTYLGTILFFIKFRHLISQGEISKHVFIFYFGVGIPILIAVSIVQIFLRPIYVISTCHIYSDYLNEKEQQILIPKPPSKSVSAFVAFAILLIFLAVIFLYRDALGITKLLSIPYSP